MCVCKFLSKEFALSNLTSRRVKISEYSDMNDPFELRGAMLFDPGIQGQLVYRFRSIGRYALAGIGEIRCSGATTLTSIKASASALIFMLTRL